MENPCAFCEIVAGRAAAAMVWEDDSTMAFIDLRQANPGHTLVVPRRHIGDVRELDPETGSKLMDTVVRVTRAVDAAFPSEGISLWHSIGAAAFQEIPHLHIHIHPRISGDGLLKVYPVMPEETDESTLSDMAERIRAHF